MRLIDVDEVKKRFPIMENDFGMVINERLHKELDKIPTVEAIPLSIIDDIKAEIIKMRSEHNCSCSDCLDIIDKYLKEGE